MDDPDEEEELGTYPTHAERLDLQRKINVLRSAVLDFDFALPTRRESSDGKRLIASLAESLGRVKLPASGAH